MPEIVYEDNHLLITIKPPNQLTQGDDTGDWSLLDECKEYIRNTYHKPGEVYLGLVHRLDRPVGGLVAFAKTSKAASRLSEQLRSHTMHRDYLCVVENGSTMPEQGRLQNYLQKDEASGNVIIVPKSEAAQEAALHYEVLGRQGDTALVHVVLETGRKHQIRVQLAGCGHPILYDMRYGRGDGSHAVSLWGAALVLIHPTLKEPKHFYSFPRGEAFSHYSNELKRWFQTMQEEAQ